MMRNLVSFNASQCHQVFLLTIEYILSVIVADWNEFCFKYRDLK